MIKNKVASLLILVLLSGCAVWAGQTYQSQYGESAVRDRVVSDASRPFPDYVNDIKPIFDSRCVVCHGCYDASCQLKMSSFEGIDRGASKNVVYNGARLQASEPSRLGIDAENTQAWREKSFFPVLNEFSQTAAINKEASLLYRMLTLKREHPLPKHVLLPESLPLDPARSLECPTLDQFDRFSERRPLWGMPYGLPGLNDREFNAIEQWIEAGALFNQASVAPVSVQTARWVEQWEAFFNGAGTKQKLVSRYLFEHLFLAHFYAPHDADKQGEARRFFRLIRSTTPPGMAAREIATRRPYEDPGSEPFFYRIVPLTETVTAKNHLPYRLDDARMQRWKEWFIDADYTVAELPGYREPDNANPFVTFDAIPVIARHRFLLDEAAFTIDNFIKGPVCRGQIALSVIDDHFWVFFTNPDVPQRNSAEEFYENNREHLSLPAAQGSNSSIIGSWRKYSELQREYFAAKRAEIDKLFPPGRPLDLNILWDGGGINRNAALTVFRHFDSASVTPGLVGGPPKTAWLIDYSVLERIHYLLVAGYDVYGNVGHQLVTRLYMDFLRMESEYNFLLMLPNNAAAREIALWYRDDDDVIKAYTTELHQRDREISGIRYVSDNPKLELYQRISERLGETVAPHDSINRPAEAGRLPARQAALHQLSTVKGAALSHMPEYAILAVKPGDGGDLLLYSLMRNRAHTNISSPFGESSRLIESEQTLSVVPGIVGYYPNHFFYMREQDVADFAKRVGNLRSHDDYDTLAAHYAMRRTNPHFWTFSDAVHKRYFETDPIRAGYLDYNRFENR